MARRLLPVALYVLCFTLIALCCMMTMLYMPTVTDGGSLKASWTYCALEGARWDEQAGMYAVQVGGAWGDEAWMLVSLRTAPRELSVDGERVPVSSEGSISGRIYSAVLPLRGGTARVTIGFPGARKEALGCMVLCRASLGRWLIALHNMVVPMVYGVLLTAALYGFSLYFFRHIRVLLLFSLYVLSLLLWCVCTQGSPLGATMENLGRAMFDCAVVLGAATCIGFCTFGGGETRWAWRSLPLVCLLYIGVSSLLSARGKEMMMLFVYAITGGLLIVSCIRSKRVPWLVLIGHAVTQAFRFSAIAYTALGRTLSFHMAYLQMMRMFTMPYVFACMVYINSLYGSKFKEAEQLAQKLEEANRELDQKVEMRTAELVEQQRFKTNLLTNIFHDLRSPLMVMKGCVDKLLGEMPNNGNLEVLSERLQFTTELTEDLFAVVKLEDHSELFETEPIPMRPLLEAAVTGLRIEAEKRHVVLETQLEDHLVAWGDEVWLKRAAQNLIRNAIYYTRPQKGSVQVTLKREGDAIALYVTDHGVGIEPEDQKLIFQRYYRVSGVHKHESSGLGLSIALSVAERHGGELTVSSTVGEGTTFVMKLPLWGVDEGEADDVKIE